MKKFLSFVVLLYAISLSAQTSNKIYLDSTFTQTLEGDHVYYRIVDDSDRQRKHYTFRDYYRSGNLLSEAVSSVKEYFRGVGTMIKYFEDGTKSEILTYDDGKLSGKYLSFYPNGQSKIEGNYVKMESKSSRLSPELEIVNYYSPDNIQTVINGDGTMEFEDVFVSEKGAIKNRRKDGVWSGYDKMINMSFTETYKKGKLVSGRSSAPFNDYDYTLVEERPTFSPSVEAFYRYVAKNFRTPDTNDSGRIILSFVINREGAIENIKIRRGISALHDAEAIRVMSASPNWVAGKKRGKPVRVSYSLPINIQAP